MTETIETDADRFSRIQGSFAKYKRNGELTFHYCFSFVNRFVFFPMPKAANSSIKLFLMKLEAFSDQNVFAPSTLVKKNVHNLFVGPLLYPHAITGRDELAAEVLCAPEYYRFTTCRDPFSRVLSCYLDRFHDRRSGAFKSIRRQARKAGLDLDFAGDIGFADFLGVVDSFDDIRDMDQHYRPQFHQCHADVLRFDHIIRFEDLARGTSEALRHIYGARTDQLDLGTNASPMATDARAKISSYYDARTEDLIRRIYKPDFDFFGYPDTL